MSDDLCKASGDGCIAWTSSSLLCSAAAGARNYATAPPVLRAITGSARLVSAPAPYLTSASSQVRPLQPT